MTQGRPPYTLTINDQEIRVPGDYVLVRRDVFERVAKSFGYIANTIAAYGPTPENWSQHGLIQARVEASDAEGIVREMADSEGTTEIHTARPL